jgi:hypothetical protein
MTTIHTGAGLIPWGLDQACLNACAWSVDLGVAFISCPNHQGFALSLHHESHFQFNRDGRLINQDQSIVPVVHQYDRHAWLERMVLASLL